MIKKHFHTARIWDKYSKVAPKAGGMIHMDEVRQFVAENINKKLIRKKIQVSVQGNVAES